MEMEEKRTKWRPLPQPSGVTPPPGARTEGSPSGYKATEIWTWVSPVPGQVARHRNAADRPTHLCCMVDPYPTVPGPRP